jgi:two-component system response regulator HydG
MATPLLLIVDDDPAHRLMLATLFEEWGYRIEEADNGLKALSFVLENQVDMILMDIRMPGMDGIEATKQILGIHPLIPIVIMTAYSSVSAADKALEAGAAEYLTKPLDFKALRSTMERLKGRNDYLERNEDALHNALQTANSF